MKKITYASKNLSDFQPFLKLHYVVVIIILCAVKGACVNNYSSSPFNAGMHLHSRAVPNQSQTLHPIRVSDVHDRVRRPTCCSNLLCRQFDLICLNLTIFITDIFKRWWKLKNKIKFSTDFLYLCYTVWVTKLQKNYVKPHFL